MGIIYAKDGTQLDEATLTLTKAIRRVESGGDYTIKGASGESGAYQFMPATWKVAAKKYLGNANAPMTPVNQDKAAYYNILDLKNQGYTPKQIASIWNSGKPNWEGKVGVNSKGVKYDVPKYVNSVINSYKAIQTDLIVSKKQSEVPVVAPAESPDLGDKVQGVIQDLFRPILKFGVTTRGIIDATPHIFSAILAKVKGNEDEFIKQTMLASEVTERGPGSYGYLGEVAPVSSTKEAVGIGMELGAWLIPGASATAKFGTKALVWGAQGFSFGAGDALGEGKSVKEAILQGTETAALNIGLGTAILGATKLENSAVKAIKKYTLSTGKKLFSDSTELVSKYPTLGELGLQGTKGAVGAEQLGMKAGETPYAKWELEWGKPKYKLLFNSLKSVAEKEKGELFSKNFNWNKILGLLAISGHPTGAISAFLGKAGIDFLGTTSGKIIWTGTLKKVFEELLKLEPATRNRIAVPFVASALSELMDNINEEFKK